MDPRTLLLLAIFAIGTLMIATGALAPFAVIGAGIGAVAGLAAAASLAAAGSDAPREARVRVTRDRRTGG